MTAEQRRAVYDDLLPGWREAPIVDGHRCATCPLCKNPSLDVHERWLIWSCRFCGHGGGASELARLASGTRKGL